MLESMKGVAYEQYVIDDEIIGMALRLLKGIQIDDETLGFDAIREVGPSGNFLSSMHTVKFMRQEYFNQTQGDRQSREAWEKSGSLTAATAPGERPEKFLIPIHPKGSIQKSIRRFESDSTSVSLDIVGGIS